MGLNMRYAIDQEVFQLAVQEIAHLRSQFATSSAKPRRIGFMQSD